MFDNIFLFIILYMERNVIPNINNLHEIRNNKEKVRNDVFILVLNKCIEKIVYTNKNTDKTFILFELPKILIGFPYYDIKTCMAYLIKKLSDNNYKVDFIEPFYLYIDWGTIQKDMHSEKLKSKTKELLKKFPNVGKVVFEYKDKT